MAIDRLERLRNHDVRPILEISFTILLNFQELGLRGYCTSGPFFF